MVKKFKLVSMFMLVVMLFVGASNISYAESNVQRDKEVIHSTNSIEEDIFVTDRTMDELKSFMHSCKVNRPFLVVLFLFMCAGALYMLYMSIDEGLSPVFAITVRYHIGRYRHGACKSSLRESK